MAATEAVPNKADSSTAESEHQESKQVIEWSSETKQVSLRTKLEEAEKAHDASAAGWEWPEWATAPAWPSRDLARFLIARQGDETKSLRMLVRHIQWRVQECPWFPHSLPPLQPVHSALSSGKVWVAGRTKQGFPLAWVKAQHHVVADTTPEQSEALVTFVIEQLVRAACVPSQTTSESNEEATVQLPGKFVAVVDMAEYGYANLDTGIVKTLLATLSRNFPERMYRIYIFNEGWVFWILWKVIEGLLDERVKNKIVFLGSEYKQALLAEIPASALPTEYGGARENPFNVSAWCTQYGAILGKSSSAANTSFTKPLPADIQPQEEMI